MSFNSSFWDVSSEPVSEESPTPAPGDKGQDHSQRLQEHQGSPSPCRGSAAAPGNENPKGCRGTGCTVTAALGPGAVTGSLYSSKNLEPLLPLPGYQENNEGVLSAFMEEQTCEPAPRTPKPRGSARDATNTRRRLLAPVASAKPSAHQGGDPEGFLWEFHSREGQGASVGWALLHTQSQISHLIEKESHLIPSDGLLRS